MVSPTTVSWLPSALLGGPRYIDILFPRKNVVEGPRGGEDKCDGVLDGPTHRNYTVVVEENRVTALQRRCATVYKRCPRAQTTYQGRLLIEDWHRSCEPTPIFEQE